MRFSIRILALCLFFMAVLSDCALGLDVWEAQHQMQAAMPGESRELLSGVSVEEDGQLEMLIAKIVHNAKKELAAGWRSGLTSILKVSVITLLCGAAKGLSSASGVGTELPIVPMAGILATASIVLLDMHGLMMLCKETMESISVFSKTMIPIMAGAVSVSGAPARAAAMQAVTVFALDLVIRMIESVLMPAVGIYLSVMTINYALGQDILRKAGEFILWLVRTVLKAALTLFVSYLTISGVFSGSADGLALKTAKAALSGAIPVVGGVVSDAAESLLAGASVIRGFTGVFGLLCIIAICLVPFFKLGINYLMFKGGAALLSIFSGKEMTGYLSVLSDGFGVLLGMVGTCAAILFFEIVFSITMIGG